MTGVSRPRPIMYHQHWSDAICQHIAGAHSLRSFCDKKGNPSYPTVMRWLKDHEAFRENYRRAREESADADADYVGYLAEKAALGRLDPQAARVAIDARKWAAGKRKPKVYGDRIDQNVKHEGSINLVVSEQDMKLL